MTYDEIRYRVDQITERMERRERWSRVTLILVVFFSVWLGAVMIAHCAEWQDNGVAFCAVVPAQSSTLIVVEQACVAADAEPEACFDLDFFPSERCPRPEWAGPFMEGPFSVFVVAPVTIAQERTLLAGGFVAVQSRSRRVLYDPMEGAFGAVLTLSLDDSRGVLALTLRRRTLVSPQAPPELTPTSP